MSSMKDFKNIADEIMSDINAGEELKKKTLMQCTKKRPVPVIRILVPAACFVFILAAVSMSGLLSHKPNKGELGNMGNENFSIMSGTGEGIEILPGETGNSTGLENDKVKNWTYKTLEEASKGFGEFFLAPSFIPEDFELEQVYAEGSNDKEVTKVVISYLSGDKSFLIIEEKTDLQSGLMNFQAVDINGTKGYSKPYIEGGEIPDAEIHWFKDGIHYSVCGLITEEEAINIARSMKY